MNLAAWSPSRPKSSGYIFTAYTEAVPHVDLGDRYVGQTEAEHLAQCVLHGVLGPWPRPMASGARTGDPPRRAGPGPPCAGASGTAARSRCRHGRTRRRRRRRAAEPRRHATHSGTPSSPAVVTSVTTGRSSRSTATSSAAPSATQGSVATTTAIGSPPYRTTPCANGGCRNRLASGVSAYLAIPVQVGDETRGTPQQRLVDLPRHVLTDEAPSQPSPLLLEPS